MGAFLMVRQQSPVSAEAAQNIFTGMGLKSPAQFRIGDYTIWSWKKMRSDEDHFVCYRKATLICAGTPIYKGADTLTASLQMILADLQENKFRYSNVRGCYGMIYSPDGESVNLITDQSGMWNIYHDTTADIISTSFLAAIFGLQKKVSLNRFAAMEVVTSGRLIGPDTLFNEIHRLEITLQDKLGNIPIVKENELLDFPSVSSKGFDETVAEQIEAINDYFEDVKNFGKNYGVDTGLTGGHDSRMMLIQVRKFFTNFQIHSFWRKTKDLELTIAEKVAEKANVPLRIIEGRHHLDKDNDQLKDTLRKSLFFYDGHIRMHCFLMEDYHTIEHRTAILGDKYLGINGIGGEQYRNEWHMEMPSWSLDYFTKYPLTYNLAGKSITDGQFEKQYFKYLSAKLLRKLKLPLNTKRLSKKDIQKYYNEIYVASLMSVRTNAENALGHFITPFIDRQLTRLAYRSLPHHGISFDFQQEMIRKMDPELASVESGYGYSFTAGEPLKKKIKYLIKEFTPKEIYQRKVDRKMSAAGNKNFEDLVTKYPVFRESVDFLRRFNLPIDEKIVTARPDLMPVYLSLAYFLDYLWKENRLEQ